MIRIIDLQVADLPLLVVQLMYVREGCLEKDGMLCKRCGKAEWVGPKFSRIPAPYPDPDNAGHYLPLSKTPRTINGNARAIDDLAPRANIRKLFKDGSISSSNCEKLRTFSEEFCVEEKHVVSYVKHLEQLANVASIRERERRLNRTIEEGKQL